MLAVGQVERAEALMQIEQDTLGALHPDTGMPERMEAEDRELRTQYLRDKKMPQLRWMLQQVATTDGGLDAKLLFN